MTNKIDKVIMLTSLFNPFTTKYLFLGQFIYTWIFFLYPKVILWNTTKLSSNIIFIRSLRW